MKKTFLKIDALSRKLGILLCIIIGLYFLYNHFATPELTGEEDLSTLNVIIEDYAYEVHENDERLPTYYIKALQYANLFKVPSEDIWLFDMNEFEVDNPQNKEVQIKISNMEMAGLDQPEKIIPIYGLSKPDKVYLSSKDTLRENQGPVKLMISLLFFAVAGFLWVLLKKKL
ncbi:hypothetical protein [Salinimicrobium sp. GXAS 041]|uniref:hypothetical protein n=1 Tax=Salinimicrobium sp. GXAS 041 TaxID=3400806 RepID=UPI003C7209E0